MAALMIEGGFWKCSCPIPLATSEIYPQMAQIDADRKLSPTGASFFQTAQGMT
ncbi:MAG: hypothetical protein VKK04_11815 [Synechococcales bacterium]|nr:hypothetical protein [Synechococcales bacterium]